MRLIINTINRKPIDIETADNRRFYVAATEARSGRGDLSTNNKETHAFGTSKVEIEAKLLATSFGGEQLDRLALKLASQPFVSQAFWSQNTVD